LESAKITIINRNNVIAAPLARRSLDEGHCRVPGSHVENGFKLGIWVDTQRQRRKKAGMGKERIKRLDELGFLWTAQS
jgi:hypothetical protein